MNYVNVVFILIGVFSALIGISGMGLQTRKAQRLVRVIGEVPTRVFYVVLGLAMVLAGILVDFAAMQ